MDMSLKEARDFLSGSTWLQGFPDDLRESFLAGTRLMPPYDRGQRVYNVGDPPNGMFGVISGSFGFEIAPMDEGPQLIHQIRPGIWFGELAHVLDHPRMAAIVATRPSQCLCVPEAALTKLLHNDPRLWKHISIALANVTVLAFAAINDLMLRSPKRRLAAALLRLAGYSLEDPLDGTLIELDITHGSLATLSAVSRSTVAHCLQEMQAEGYLQHQYGKVVLTDAAALRKWLRTELE